MNRREFLAAGFKLGAAGLLLPAIEPIRRYWSLDRTMLTQTSPWDDPVIFQTGVNDFDASVDKFFRALESRSTPFLTIHADNVYTLPSTVTWGDYRFPMAKGGRLQGDSFIVTAISSDEWVIHE